MSFLPFRWRSVARSLFALVALVAGAHAQAPTADFSGTPLTGVAPHTVSFTNFTSGDATSWAWTFGDGGTSTDSDPAKTDARQARIERVRVDVPGAGLP